MASARVACVVQFDMWLYEFVMCGSCADHVQVNLGRPTVSFWLHAGCILAAFVLGSKWRQSMCGQCVGQCAVDVRVDVRSMCGRCAVDVRSMCWSMCGPCAVDVRSMCGSMCGRCAGRCVSMCGRNEQVRSEQVRSEPWVAV